jgi:DNA-binding XRE family transcriptional regulator
MPKNIAIALTPNLKTAITPELIGKAIHAKRTQSQLRLEDAAALCGVAKQTLMKAEHGHPNTKISTLLQICSSLGIVIIILPWQENEEVNDEWQ